MKEPLIIDFTPRADQQLEEAHRWWGKERPDEPDRFAANLEQTLNRIAVFPNAGAVARNVRLPDVRRARLTGTPYHVYYRVRGQPPRVQIIAVWHVRRGAPPPL